MANKKPLQTNLSGLWVDGDDPRGFHVAHFLPWLRTGSSGQSSPTRGRLACPSKSQCCVLLHHHGCGLLLYEQHGNHRSDPAIRMRDEPFSEGTNPPPLYRRTATDLRQRVFCKYSLQHQTSTPADLMRRAKIARASSTIRARSIESRGNRGLSQTLNPVCRLRAWMRMASL